MYLFVLRLSVPCLSSDTSDQIQTSQWSSKFPHFARFSSLFRVFVTAGKVLGEEFVQFSDRKKYLVPL